MPSSGAAEFRVAGEEASAADDTEVLDVALLAVVAAAAGDAAASADGQWYDRSAVTARTTAALSSSSPRP